MAATFQSARGRRTRRSINDINMVPFIDVMLVLLIIFMVTAPLITPSVIDIPSVGKAASAPDRVITIEIGKDSRIEVRQRATGSKGTDSLTQATLDPVLAALKAGQVIREEGPQSHLSKAGTPSMGGIFIIIAAFLIELQEPVDQDNLARGAKVEFTCFRISDDIHRCAVCRPQYFEVLLVVRCKRDRLTERHSLRREETKAMSIR